MKKYLGDTFFLAAWNVLLAMMFPAPGIVDVRFAFDQKALTGQ